MSEYIAVSEDVSDEDVAPEKQAVVIIHGMGEQRPMETLRSFVKAIWESDPDIKSGDENDPMNRVTPIASYQGQALPDAVYNKAWMAPDTKTGSTELHRMTTEKESTGNYRVDFFEMYWADIMAGSTFSHVKAWLSGLMLRWPHQVPRDVLLLWIFLWFTLFGLVFVGLVAAPALLSLIGFPDFNFSILDLMGLSWLEEFRLGTIGAYVLQSLGVLLVVYIAAVAVFGLLRTALEDGFISGDTAAREIKDDRVAYSVIVASAIAMLVIWAISKTGNYLANVSIANCLSVIGFGLLAGINSFLVPYFGDVARYVQATPETVSKRSQVRERGVRLLRALHNLDDKGKPIEGKVPDYGRVIVVAHSLGSIIAYDLLLQFWAEAGPIKGDIDPSVRRAFEVMDSFIQNDLDAQIEAEKDGRIHEFDREEFRKLQARITTALARTNARWRITDFVTLGSPLTHAEFLVAQNEGRFRRMFENRLISACPPFPFRNGEGSIFYPRSDGETGVHHATPFAAIRWTNIFDLRPPILQFYGDAISGPLQENFGKGISDRLVRIRRRAGLQKESRLFTHTSYWDTDAKGLTDEEYPVPANSREAKQAPTSWSGSARLTHIGLLRHAVGLRDYKTLKTMRGKAAMKEVEAIRALK